jgi:predicted DNA-binding transcriptional regulator AlpA
VRERINYAAAAAYIGVPLATLRSLVSRKQVPHIRLTPRIVVFEVAELDEWIANTKPLLKGGGRPSRVAVAGSPVSEHYVSWRDALALGVAKGTLSRWAKTGQVRYQGELQDRTYLPRDLATKIAQQRGIRAEPVSDLDALTAFAPAAAAAGESLVNWIIGACEARAAYEAGSSTPDDAPDDDRKGGPF